MDITVQFVKKDGKFQLGSIKDEQTYNQFKSDLPEGTKIEAYMEVNLDDGTLGQLAKVHATIREVCYHTGEPFARLKRMVKVKAGLYLEYKVAGERYVELKSFGDCSYKDLSLAIQAAQEIGMSAGMITI
jgi:hypothetical protein